MNFVIFLVELIGEYCKVFIRMKNMQFNFEKL